MGPQCSKSSTSVNPDSLSGYIGPGFSSAGSLKALAAQEERPNCRNAIGEAGVKPGRGREGVPRRESCAYECCLITVKSCRSTRRGRRLLPAAKRKRKP